MPDSPDYSRYLPGSTRYSLQDLGELAARLGSPMHFDRRGEVVFYDTFAHGLTPWNITTSGTGAGVSLTADHVYRYPYASKLVCGTTGTKSAAMTRRVGASQVARVGFEVCMAVQLSKSTYDFQLVANDGNTDYRLFVRWNGTSHQWSLMDQNTNYQVVATIPMEQGQQYVYTPFKIVADLGAGKYVRLLVGRTAVDVSAYQMYDTPNTTTVNYAMSIQVVGDGSQNEELYIAHVILTENEP